MGLLRPFVFLCVVIPYSLASVTVYGQIPLGQATQSASAPTYTSPATYDPTVLNPPPVPQNFATQLSLSVPATSNNVSLSQPLKGSFLGFSIEFSVISQVCTRKKLVRLPHVGPSTRSLTRWVRSFIQVPFLNLMSNIRQRAGEIRIRVGGNTQETASLVDSLPDGDMALKEPSNLNDPTSTPALRYTADALYMLGNISSLVDVKWFLGIPFNDTANLRLQIAEVGEAVLDSGGYLLGFQVGNEPDLYAAHGVRPSTYSPYDYFGEFGIVVDAVNNDNSIPVKNNLVIPSVSGTWTPEDVFNTGIVASYDSSLGYLAVEHYPTDNCYAQYGIGSPVDPQTIFPDYLSHSSAISLVAPYLNASSYSASVGKPFVMMETNTASCGGFPGISQSFGAAMWAVDYALQMGAVGFWGAMLHVGGQDDYYNPFTPPPTNQSSYHQWTVGSVFYSTLVVAEALGSSGNARLVDLTNTLTSPSDTATPPATSIYTPAYAVYENGAPARLVVFNFVTDTSGSSTVQFTFGFGGGSVPGSVQVKYLLAPSVSAKDNITWAGQTFGSTFESDGRFQGSPSVTTISCSTSSNTCTVPLPAPCVALIFLTSSAYGESDPSTTVTFATTALTQTYNTATINPTVLATSNGMSGNERDQLASTSRENGVASMGAGIKVGLGLGLVSLAVGAWMGGGGTWW
ncbi:glycoside hydrolase family 79 protein [Pisolithus marmoratus]|nr:glycoside hydrolase family 79 protein [Pisolithus marmoratus]